MNIRNKAVILILLVVMLIHLAACGKTEGDSGHSSADSDLKTIKIGYLPITHAAPLYIEEELGKQHFKHFKLELVKFGSWPDLMDALNTAESTALPYWLNWP